MKTIRKLQATLIGGHLVAWSGDQAYRSPLGAGDQGKVEEMPRAALDKLIGGARLSLAAARALEPNVEAAGGTAELLPIHLDELSVALDRKLHAITVLGLESVAR